MFDILIKGGTVIDGTGATGYVADVAVQDGRIAAIGHNINAPANETINAAGLIVCPGFIDMHSHSDSSCMCNKTASHYLEQGITTEITGQCGFGPFPFHECFDSKYHIYGNSMPPSVMAHMAEMTTLKKLYDYIDETGNGTNFASYVAHGMVRMAVMGYDNRVPTEDEMAQMEELVRLAMADGARGISSGLIYPPGIYATSDELTTLCRVVAEFGGTYVTHIRTEGDGVADAMREAIDVARRAGVPLHISHLKASGKRNWGRANELLGIIEQANRSGMEVSTDHYPYTAGSNNFSNNIPPQYATSGNTGILEKLADPITRAAIKADMQSGERQNSINELEPNEIIIQSRIIEPETGFIYLSDYMAAQGFTDKFEAYFDVLTKDVGCDGIFFATDEADVETIVRHPYVMAGTDGMVQPVPQYPGMPRSYGTFPRIIGRYCRDKRLMRLEECIRKLTSLPANKARLHSKGVIKTGLDADITIFDFATIKDNATYQNFQAPNDGIHYVLVNGQLAVRDGKATGTLAGRAIR